MFKQMSSAGLCFPCLVTLGFVALPVMFVMAIVLGASEFQKNASEVKELRQQVAKLQALPQSTVLVAKTKVCKSKNCKR